MGVRERLGGSARRRDTTPQRTARASLPTNRWRRQTQKAAAKKGRGGGVASAGWTVGLQGYRAACVLQRIANGSGLQAAVIASGTDLTAAQRRRMFYRTPKTPTGVAGDPRRELPRTGANSAEVQRDPADRATPGSSPSANLAGVWSLPCWTSCKGRVVSYPQPFDPSFPVPSRSS